MRIQHNIAALNSYRNLSSNNASVSGNLEKLSSGYKINRAGDDAAGLAISEKMRAQITGLETAQNNANDGISLVQTAEGALTEVHSMLNRMVELADQSANGTYDNDDRKQLQKEITSLNSEIDRISQGTNFNGINLLDGSLGKTTGAPATMLSTATAITDAQITKVGGAALASGSSVAVTQDGTNKNMLSVTITNADGTASTKNVDLEKVIKYTNGTDAGKSIGSGTTALAKGDTVSIDLSSVGLGSIDLTATGAVTVENIGASLATIAGDSTAAAGAGEGLKLQIGDTADTFNQLTVSIGNMSSSALNIGDVTVADQTSASDAITRIKAAINTVSSTRGDLGAIQNRLDHTIKNLSVTTENMTAAESRIRDVDMAKEMMAYTKNNILVQSSTAMLAQANQVPQGVLQLLQ